MADTTKRLDRAEIAKRVERAEKLLQKGKTAEALDEYLLFCGMTRKTMWCGSWRPICVFRWGAIRTR